MRGCDVCFWWRGNLVSAAKGEKFDYRVCKNRFAYNEDEYLNVCDYPGAGDVVPDEYIAVKDCPWASHVEALLKERFNEEQIEFDREGMLEDSSREYIEDLIGSVFLDTTSKLEREWLGVGQIGAELLSIENEIVGTWIDYLYEEWKRRHESE